MPSLPRLLRARRHSGLDDNRGLTRPGAGRTFRAAATIPRGHFLGQSQSIA